MIYNTWIILEGDVGEVFSQNCPASPFCIEDIDSIFQKTNTSHQNYRKRSKIMSISSISDSLFFHIDCSCFSQPTIWYLDQYWFPTNHIDTFIYFQPIILTLLYIFSQWYWLSYIIFSTNHIDFYIFPTDHIDSNLS